MTNDPKRDELADRLMDQALHELLSGERPPDLSQKILAAVENTLPCPSQRKVSGMAKSKRRYLWSLLALAASLLLGFALLMPAKQSAREVAHLAAPAPSPQAVHKEKETAAEPQPQWASPARPAPSPGKADSQQSNRAKDAFSHKVDLQDSMAPSASTTASAGERQGQGPGLGKAAAPAAEAPASPASSDILKFSVGVPSDSGLIGPPLEDKERGDAFRALNSVDEANKRETAARPGFTANQPQAMQGHGPGMGGDKYGHLAEAGFQTVKDHPLSTFSIDVDTASYANVRRFLLQDRQLPPPDAVRIEELVNYFDYHYAGPEGDVPFAAHLAVAGCPWQPEHRLVRIALKGKEVAEKERPASNLVFLLDVSGSMQSEDKLPLLKQGMKLLAEQVREQDRVAIVVYAGTEGVALPSTSGAQRDKILAALDQLQSGGSTNGGAGIQLAYRIAQENFIPKGVNRVILCTDGDFNVGTTSQGDLVRIVEEKAKSGVFLSVLGFGRGNLNDAMMVQIADKGNGNYAYIDSLGEARKVLVQQMGGTLVTIAKDVKIQVEFNPAQVAAYRLIGYEKRILATEDFKDDRKDAGEIGAGHTVTALYELVPTGQSVDTPGVDPLKYQPAPEANPVEPAATSKELLTVKLRYKEPDADTSKPLEFPLTDGGATFAQADTDFQFAASVASFGMLLRNSPAKGNATYAAAAEIAASAKGADEHGYRAEFVEMVRRAAEVGK